MASAALSKPGGRAVNEDALGGVAPQEGLGCWVVADGQGKRGGGDEAARKSVKAILDAFAARPAVAEEALARALRAAEKAVTALQAEIVRNQSLRVAAAMLCADGREALWAHVGDVRVYAFRDGALLARTTDHSLSQTLVNAGELEADEARSHVYSRRLLRALGAPGGAQPTVLPQPFALRPGDAFLLCSGGFWQYVTELEMVVDWCKSATLESWLEHMEMRLLQTVPADCDNYSAIALRVEMDS